MYLKDRVEENRSEKLNWAEESWKRRQFTEDWTGGDRNSRKLTVKYQEGTTNIKIVIPDLCHCLGHLTSYSCWKLGLGVSEDSAWDLSFENLQCNQPIKEVSSSKSLFEVLKHERWVKTEVQIKIKGGDNWVSEEKNKLGYKRSPEDHNLFSSGAVLKRWSSFMLSSCTICRRAHYLLWECFM